jgi:hypothetical protein
MSDELPTAQVNLTRKETDLIISGVGMLWNARRFARIDESGNPYEVHHDVVALLDKLKRFRESANSERP